MSHIRNIEDLPDELLLEIFASLTIEDLILSVPFVSRRWKYLCLDNLLWRDRVYRPGLKTDDKHIAHTFSQPSKLQTLQLERGVKCFVLNAIAQNCPCLKKLEFIKVQRFSVAVLKNLLCNSPNIEWLTLPGDLFWQEEQVEIVAQFKKLKCLTICEGYDGPGYLRIIADGCPVLEQIDFGGRNVSGEGLKYFLDKKGAQLTSIALSWVNSEYECNLPLLLGCSSLRSLCITSFYDEDTELGFQILRSLRSLTSLAFCDLNNANVRSLLRVFEQRAMDQLEELIINNYVNYEDRVAQTIMKNCPKLKVLSLENCCNLTDISLERIGSLHHLEKLTVSYISDAGITYITKCKSLTYLNLGFSPKITEEGWKRIASIRELRSLELFSCNMRGFPFHSIPTNLKKLIMLNMKFCSNVDRDSMIELQSVMPYLKISSDQSYTVVSHNDETNEDSILAEAFNLFEQLLST